VSLSVSDLRDEMMRRGALLEGHFRLSSGRHSDRFVQKFRILEDPVLVEAVAREIADRVRAYKPTIVVSAAVGGIVLGYEIGRALGTKAIFVEKEHGAPALRRGFELSEDDRVLVVEDVITTGKSVREVMDVVRAEGATVVAVGIIVRREPIELGVPTVALLDLPVESFDPSACPLCAKGSPVTEPGSRFLST
jgi:orotate phosphoribosyltransferase